MSGLKKRNVSSVLMQFEVLHLLLQQETFKICLLAQILHPWHYVNPHFLQFRDYADSFREV